MDMLLIELLLSFLNHCRPEVVRLSSILTVFTPAMHLIVLLETRA